MNSVLSTIMASAVTDVDHARLNAASAPHSGDWLNTPPIASLGLKLTDDEVRISVALKLGIRACLPHNCVCGKLLDARGLHGLSCERSTPRHQRHAMSNDIIWRSIKRAQISAHKEPTGLVSEGGKRPNGITMIPWARGKPLAWDVTVPDTYAESHIISTSAEAAAVVKHAATIKTTKYSDITSIHIFYPISIETAGSWDVQAVELWEEIGRRTTSATNDKNETMYLFQRISMTIQRGNALSFFFTHSRTTSTKNTVAVIQFLYIQFPVCRLCACGR